MEIVSIVIPVYNCEKYILNCLDSVKAQTYSNWECIIVNDGSSDNTKSICEEYCKKDLRFKYYEKENGGAASARKFGVEKAIGNWIFFSDGDDIIPENSLFSLLSHDNGQCDIIAGTILYESTDTLYYTKSREVSTSTDTYIRYLLEHSTYIGPCSKLIKRELFRKIGWSTDQRITNFEDLLMLICLSVASNNKVVFLNDVVNYICYSRPNSCSSRPMSYEGCKLLLSSIWTTLYKAQKLNDEIKIAYFRFALRLLRSMCLNHNCWFNTDGTIQRLIDIDKELSTDTNSRDKRIIFSPFFRALYILANHVR